QHGQEAQINRRCPMIERLLLCGLVVGATLSALEPAPAATCRNAGAFGPWLEAFKQEALAQKISQRAFAAALPELVFDQTIINRDRGQKFFAQNFLEFS